MLKSPVESTTGPGTTVGVNVALTGTLRDQNDIVIYGMVEGEVNSDRSVMVGETAQIKGPVRGQKITVAGVVRGSIEALEKLELLTTGKVYGSIASKDLVINSGAIFVGKCTMAGEEDISSSLEAGAEKKVSEPAKVEVKKSTDSLGEEKETDFKEDVPLPEPEDE